MRLFEPIRLLPKRIFIQYLNPEILSLYGVTQHLNDDNLLVNSLKLTAYALLLSDDALIIPESYLFQLNFIDRFLKEVEVLRAAGILQLAGPTPDLTRYATSKKQEYRDEPTLFPKYEREDPAILKKPLVWAPRIKRSASQDISVLWRSELHINGLWREILKTKTAKDINQLYKIEDIIHSVPDDLEGKAFIYRYAKQLLEISLTLVEETQISMMISRGYLDSYLKEFDALVMNDTPIGKLDCDLPPIDPNGRMRTISYRVFFELLQILYIENCIESRLLGWRQLILLRNHTAFRWITNLAIMSSIDPLKPLDTAILRSKYRPLEKARNLRGNKLLQNIFDRSNHFFDSIEPFIGDYSTELLRSTEPVVPKQRVIQTEDLQIELFPTKHMINANDVFLVYGRDKNASRGMKELLRSVQINPVEWEQAVNWTGKGTPSIFEVIQTAINRVQAVVVLFTPDEHVQLREEWVTASDPDYEKNRGFQPRPNVLLETGMAFALYPERTLIVEVGGTRTITDLAGLHTIRFDGSPKSRNTLLDRLSTAGCSLNRMGGDYLSAGFDYLRTP